MFLRLVLSLALLTSLSPFVAWAEPGLSAGAATVSVNPPRMPVLVNGGMLTRSTDKIAEGLSAQALVLDDGTERIALVVVDSCMVPRELLDEAKRLASRESGIRPDRMLISATHTHSAPAAMGCLGTDRDDAYAEFLPGQIARTIIQAAKNLKPAQLGYGKAPAPENVFIRRWLMKPGTAQTNPFGGTVDDQAKMNPGHQNPNAIRPLGAPDTDVTVLSIQTRDGRPLALLSNYSTHYAGAPGPGLSADYFGVFRELMEREIAGEGGNFVALMNNGTSGDANCHDFSKPARNFDRFTVARDVAAAARKAMEGIEYRHDVKLAMAERRMTLDVRMPTAEEVEKARDFLMANDATNRPPKNVPEVYARETIILSELPPTREVCLQAVRIGDLGLTAIPCEVYTSTGLTLKKESPFPITTNISLANGADGYLPPPEDHKLGGYTTWRARTSCLEVEAEPKIRQAVLELLKTVRTAE
jgi:hypothetical protein